MPFSANTPKKTRAPSMAEVDADEQLVTTIYRHPFAIVILFIQVGFGLAAATGLIFFMLPQFVTRDDNPQVYAWAAVILMIVGLFMGLILLVATIIHRQSRLIMTNKTVTEIIQEGLFNRRIAQLNVSNIEDATADRNGVFQTFFNFGILNIETAGQTPNFYFKYCPEPDKYAKIVLELRENFLASHRPGAPDDATEHYTGTSNTVGSYNVTPVLPQSEAMPTPPSQQYSSPVPPSPYTPVNPPHEADYRDPAKLAIAHEQADTNPEMDYREPV